MEKLNDKEWEEHNEKMRRIRAEWKPQEWAEMEEKLKALSLDELRRIATLAGMHFEGGNKSVIDKPQMSAKEQFVLVLDEVGKEDLLSAYNAVLQEQKRVTSPP